ncbi:hypothetical protein CMU59_18295 [Elizabethkingia anophelis]|uniref:sensor histidine kinase n=1 Tax=Elizabethkingia anophelis TaxID=1117645 RepID=UPI0021A7798E|nr:histidine kinase [Elizabethkingia anophelis]MCT3947650.1 histidine kinase [Elizabethkingia anophelis]MDV3573467.1 hypothetical protein [Elizabethkingia anophelis]MDV3601325.1 hypothetical protein [Elizabethkingia anophelis]MDV3608610.1 hypothetical protein [Elizabethkingia anophelis]
MKQTNFLFGIIFSFIFSLMALSIKGSRYGDFSLLLATSTVIYNFLYGITCWIIFNRLIHFRFLLGLNINSFKVGAVSILGSALLLFVFDFTYDYFFPNSLQFQFTDLRLMYVGTLLRGIVVSGLYYFIQLYILLLKDSQLQELEVEQLKLAQLEARMSSLRAQLSPHFLFNSLNTLSILSSDSIVKSYIRELANIYRYVLVHKDCELVFVHEELDFTNAYLHIMKNRLGKALIIDISIDLGLLYYRMIPFSLQLLAENAIKHNIASLSKPLRIEIYNEGKQYIVVRNNLQPKVSIDGGTGIGLYNLMSRYELTLDKTIEIVSTENFFMIKLPILKNENTYN